jgi:hypothetical protein
MYVINKKTLLKLYRFSKVNELATSVDTKFRDTKFRETKFRETKFREIRKLTFVATLLAT